MTQLQKQPFPLVNVRVVVSQAGTCLAGLRLVFSVFENENLRLSENLKATL